MGFWFTAHNNPFLADRALFLLLKSGRHSGKGKHRKSGTAASPRLPRTPCRSPTLVPAASPRRWPRSSRSLFSHSSSSCPYRRWASRGDRPTTTTRRCRGRSSPWTGTWRGWCRSATSTSAPTALSVPLTSRCSAPPCAPSGLTFSSSPVTSLVSPRSHLSGSEFFRVKCCGFGNFWQCQYTSSLG